MHTTTPWRLVFRELFSRGTTHTYTLRSGLPATLHHGRDLEALYEIYVRGEYEPPELLASVLDMPDLRILDLGGNVGMFAGWALSRWPGAHVTSVEPDAGNVDQFRQWIHAAGAKVELIAAAAAPFDGEISFWGGRGGGSRQVPDGSGESVPAIDIFPHLANADFVKMDIEGGEWPILMDPRMKDLTEVTLVLEYHQNMAPSWPPRVAAIEALEAAGFKTGFGHQNYWGHGTIWAMK